jgi:hypothetical protein
MPIGRFRASNRRVTMTTRACPWSAARYRTQIARRASVPPDHGPFALTSRCRCRSRSGECAMVLVRCPSPPIGLTAAVLFAGGEVSSADSCVRSPGTLTYVRCPAVRSTLDTGPEAYDNPAAVWWGAYAPSTCMQTALSLACTVSLGSQWRCSAAACGPADLVCALGMIRNDK